LSGSSELSINALTSTFFPEILRGDLLNEINSIRGSVLIAPVRYMEFFSSLQIIFNNWNNQLWSEL
jgi:hypothetical protein